MTYRLYAFTNQYLATIQAGLQTAHVVAEMFCKYGNNEDVWLLDSASEDLPTAVLQHWADFDKTIIILNGGDNAAMRNLAEFLYSAPYPNAEFYESPDALYGLLTCCAVIVPEKLFGSTEEPMGHDLTAWDAEFMECKERCRLAT